MTRGASRLPLSHPLGDDLRNASVILAEMFKDATPAGREFREENAALYRQYRHLSSFLFHSSGSASVPRATVLAEYEKWFQDLQQPFTVRFPKAVQLPGADAAEQELRNRNAIEVQGSEYQRLGQPMGSESEGWEEWDKLTSNLLRWVNELERKANEGQGERISKRKYPERYRNVTLKQKIDDGRGGAIAQYRPSDEVMAALEEKLDLACVIYDWDGRSAWSVKNHIFVRCEKRLGRTLGEREKREITKQLNPQLKEARRELMESGWLAGGTYSQDDYAKWIGQKLLHPKLPLTVISGTRAGENSPYKRAHRGVNRFAEAASLNLRLRN